MGLLLNGTIDGQVYENKQVSAQQIIKMFGLQKVFADGKKTMRFDMAGTHVKKKRGNTFHPTQIAIPCQTVGSYKGDSFELTYFERRNPKKNAGQTYYEYAPRKIYMTQISMSENIQRNKDKAVFLYLCSMNALSPCRLKNDKTYYTYFDQEAKSRTAMQENLTQFGIMERIMKDPIETIRRKATGFGIAKTFEMDENTVRMKLMHQYQSFVAQGKFNAFVQKFNGENGLFLGIVMESIYRGILVQSQNGGQYVYKWGPNVDELHRGNEVHRVKRGDKAIDSLLKFATANYESVLAVIQKEIAKQQGDKKREQEVRKTEEMLSNEYISESQEAIESKEKVSDWDAVKLAKVAYQMQIIEFERETNCVYFLKKHKRDGGAIAEVAGKDDDWIKELGHEIDSSIDLRKTLAAKVQGKLNYERRSKANA